MNKKRKSTWSMCTCGPGRLLAPPPPAPLAELWGGGGGLASHVLPGDFERGRGDLWQVNSAGFSRGWIWQILMARHFSGSPWHIYLAGSPQAMKKQAVEQKKRSKRNVQSVNL